MGEAWQNDPKRKAVNDEMDRWRVMADEPEIELTREGLFEELIGKTKEAAGELIGNDALAKAGREQQAEAEAEAEAKPPSAPSDDTEGGG